MNNLLDLLKRAAIAGMLKVREGQITSDTQSDMKTDLSIVTPTDVASQDAILDVLKHWPSLHIVAEEKKGLATTIKPQPHVQPHVMVDGLDGTGAFGIGISSSTIIVGGYDSHSRKMVACVVCDPSLGRVWSADEDQPTLLEWYEDGELKRPSERKVWAAGELGKKSTILLDVSFGFRLSTDQEMEKLFNMLIPSTMIQIPGSNGLIQALVANGRKGTAGAITTAPSGPWDLCGAYLVLRAGGFVRAFAYAGDHLEEVNPLDPMSCNTLVMGANESIVNQLAEIRLAAYS